MQVGDRVKLNPSLDVFRYGQGPVSYEEIGTIIRILENNVVVDFPSHNHWNGLESELIKVETNETRVCSECGEEKNCNFIEVNGEYVCEECFNEKYFLCHKCGCIEELDNAIYIEDRDYYVCQDCADSYYYRCENCGNYVSNATAINDGTGSYYEICDSCFNNGEYYYCDGCGDYFYEDNCHWHNDYCYCDNCYDRNGGDLYDYHEFNDWQLYDIGENPTYYIGKEIELEPKSDRNVVGVLEAINNNINAVGMHDGSLRNGGVEVVTHPESWEYLQKHKQDYVNFFNEIKKLDYGNAGGCGLHFHISRPNEEVVSRVIVLLESFREEIFKLSRRSEGQMHWCQFLTQGCSEEMKTKYHSTKWLKDKYLKEGHDRYYALNLCNSKTIEFRFFNGVSTFEEYWGALQFIHNIMEIALDEKREINTINWQDLLTGEELREQARKRSVLDIDKFAKDTNEVIEKLEVALNKAKEEIARTLKNLAKYITNEMSELDAKEIKTRDITEVSSKVSNFIDKFRYRQQYLNRITDLYTQLTRLDNTLEMRDIKNYWDCTKISYPVNTGRYKRYDKLIEKAIKQYESEVR